MKARLEEVCKSALQQYAQGLLVSAQQKNTHPLHTSINEQIQGLCVAYSGGVDSTVLLHIADILCKQANIPLSAVHVNHGISYHAKEWQAHCQNQCAQRDIPFYTQSISVKKTPQQSIEADARDARYDILDDCAGQHKIVLLAQHQNDQAETLLIQLKRGAGIKGLASMPVFIKRAKGTQYLRPLLNVSRDEILRYAHKHKLKWIEDESNQDNRYDRNFLRNQVLPLLSNRWPSFSKTVARSAHHCAQANEVNTEYMQLLYTSLVDNDSIDLLSLSRHSLATKECFIRYWLSRYHQITPTNAQLSDIIRMVQVPLQNGKPFVKNASPHITILNKVIERYNNRLDVLGIALKNESSSSTQLVWNGQGVVKLNELYSLHKVDPSCHKHPNVFLLPENDVEYVFGGSNLGFKYQANRPTKTLKVWYQEWGISPLQRKQIPVFLLAKQVIAVGLEPVIQSGVQLEHSMYVELRKSTPT